MIRLQRGQKYHSEKNESRDSGLILFSNFSWRRNHPQITPITQISLRVLLVRFSQEIGVICEAMAKLLVI
jgi:hypothetical protein